MNYIIKPFGEICTEDLLNTRGIVFTDLNSCINYCFDALYCCFKIYNLNEDKVVFRSSYFEVLK